jgi:hypothetical protein
MRQKIILLTLFVFIASASLIVRAQEAIKPSIMIGEVSSVSASEIVLQTKDGTETIVFAVFEEEFRSLAQNPSQIFSPNFSLGFLAQRVLLLLFWFIISLALTTIAPGAVSRAVARFQLSTLKVFAFGSIGFVTTVIIVMSSLSFLPNYVYTIVVLMAFVLLLLSFVFGRVALQVSVGKQIQKRLLPENKQSETSALLIGALVWTLLLSIPYLWTFALVALIAASLGLVLTARSTNGWQKA